MSEQRDLVGHHVELRTWQGELFGRGKVLGYFESPTVFVQMEDGSKQSWRADLLNPVSIVFEPTEEDKP